MKACKILDTKDGILNWFNLIDKGLVGFQLLSTWFIPTCSNCSLSLLMILLCSSISAFSFSSPDKVRFRSSTSSWSTPPCLSLLVSRLWDTNSNKQTWTKEQNWLYVITWLHSSWVYEASNAVKFRKIGLSRLTERYNSEF